MPVKVGEKIKVATEPENVIGITSKTSSVIGDSAELGWNKTNEVDNLGGYILEDNYMIPIINILTKYGIKYTPNNLIFIFIIWYFI